MKNIKWLISLAKERPLLFSIALLLITILTLGVVIKERNHRVIDCERQKEIIRDVYESRIDSFYKREKELNKEVSDILNKIIQDYKKQLEEQKDINKEAQKTINKNNSLIRNKK
jgi:peptidoglycan hydrolase CwlO-like protein